MTIGNKMLTNLQLYTLGQTKKESYGLEEI